ncbi:hypothetical protein J3Q64DRAFT_1734873 [Phycomyces blakesleeanus]|uniref:Uncharacterized protein n=1 Tax=Phycomyces blakesleeanus TaxID=4837 RepID=A0ABR3B2Q8_PHYBL
MNTVDFALWKKAAREIDWFVPPSAVISNTGKGSNPYVWFPGGKLNTCYNTVDRHALTQPNQPALIWDSPVSNSKRVYTFIQLLEQVSCMAGVLREYGLKKGDTALIYMPMVPEAVFAILACARLGVVHCVVFGGFAPKELAKRIDACAPKIILTASCGIEPKRSIPYKPLLESALAMSNHRVPIKIVLQRPGQVQAEMSYDAGDRDYEKAMKAVRAEGRHVKQCEEVDSEDPLYILYTSGTTGQPKGVVRSNGGHAVALRWTMSIFAVKKGETIFTASDIGWAVSHSYTIYGPLLAGATTLLYEGKPIQTPDAAAFWRLVAEYKVKTMFTAPTAARAIRRADLHGDLAKHYDISSLKTLFLAGERSDPETLHWCQAIVGDNCRVIDNYWSTELGSPVTALYEGELPLLPVRIGSAGKKVAGSDIRILMEGTNKESTKPNQFGNIVLKLPLSPSAFSTLWENEDGYRDSYFTKYPGYFDTGDAGMIDEDGYVYIMSRTDDIINVAGHRLSTGTIEEILASHPKVAECCVVPMPDKLKGHIPLGILVLQFENETEDTEKIIQELIAATRRDLGAIACFEHAVIVRRLPKTRSGKVLRRSVRDMVEGKEVKIPATIEDETTLVEIEDALRLGGLLPQLRAHL